MQTRGHLLSLIGCRIWPVTSANADELFRESDIEEFVIATDPRKRGRSARVSPLARALFLTDGQQFPAVFETRAEGGFARF